MGPEDKRRIKKPVTNNLVSCHPKALELANLISLIKIISLYRQVVDTSIS